MLSLGAVGVVVLAAGQPGELAAGAKAVRLLYVREAGAELCPAEPEVRVAVASRLGYDPVRPDARAALLVRVARSATGMTGVIELIDEAGLSRGRRELSTEGSGCEEMARAMALSMSIAIDPERIALVGELPSAAEPPAPAKASEDAAPASPPPTLEAPVATAAVQLEASPPPAADVAAAPDRARRPRIGVSLAGLTMVGVAPTFAYGGVLGLHGRLGAWSLGLGGRLLRSPAADVDSTTQLAVTLAAADVAGCLHHGPLAYCLVGLAGASWVDASGITQPGSDAGAFGALGLRLGFAAPISPTFALQAQLEGVAVVAPVHPQVDGSDVWIAPSVAGSLAVGARADFW